MNKWGIQVAGQVKGFSCLWRCILEDLRVRQNFDSVLMSMLWDTELSLGKRSPEQWGQMATSSCLHLRLTSDLELPYPSQVGPSQQLQTGVLWPGWSCPTQDSSNGQPWLQSPCRAARNCQIHVPVWLLPLPNPASSLFHFPFRACISVLGLLWKMITNWIP